MFNPDRRDLETEWELFASSLQEGYDFDRASIEFVAGEALPRDSREKIVEVACDHGWQSSRMRVEQGRTYRVTATGLELDQNPEGVSLQAESLTIVRGSHRMEQVNFCWQSNEFVGILGPSGAGKSTLLNCIATYLPIYRGRILIDGRLNIQQNAAQVRPLLGYVPQRDQLPVHLTVRETLACAARVETCTGSSRCSII